MIKLKLSQYSEAQQWSNIFMFILYFLASVFARLKLSPIFKPMDNNLWKINVFLCNKDMNNGSINTLSDMSPASGDRPAQRVNIKYFYTWLNDILTTQWCMANGIIITNSEIGNPDGSCVLRGCNNVEISYIIILMLLDTSPLVGMRLESFAHFLSMMMILLNSKIKK